MAQGYGKTQNHTLKKTVVPLCVHLESCGTLQYENANLKPHRGVALVRSDSVL